MIRFLNSFQQTISITQFALRTVPQRLGSSLASMVGIAGVVGVLVGVLSIAEGFRITLASSAAPDNAIVLRSGSNTEMMSGLNGDDVKIITQAPGIARADNSPLASSELFVVINLAKRSTGTDANVPLRGVERAAFQVRRNLRVVAGRPFRWGLNEVMVGAAAAREFAGLDLGKTLQVGPQQWPIVGIFTTGGGLAESEIWTDAAVLQPAYRRGNTFQAVHLSLTGPDAYTTFKNTLTADPRLNVKVLKEAEYYDSQSTTLYNLITNLGSVIAALMALGAIFGALNTMYTAVSSRNREIATLRALGFQSGPVVLSVLLESTLLALAGGVLGGVVAYLCFDGFQAATLNWVSFSQVAFAFAVTPRLLMEGVLLALLIGLAGGLLPAIRAARLPVATALREP